MAWAATGSTSTFQTSVVPTIHSARDHAAVEDTPDGNAVVVSSQWSARRTASATSSFCFWVTLGSGEAAACLRAMSSARSQLTGPSCGFISDWIWVKSALRSGIPPEPGPPVPAAPPRRTTEQRAEVGHPAAEERLERRALEGVDGLVGAVGSFSSGSMPELSVMAPNYSFGQPGRAGR